MATSYRPFTGEWLGGFPGVLLAGLGAYGIQALGLSGTAVLALAAHASVCTGMLVMHHYLDAAPDEAAVPRKATAVVVLGPRAAIGYATSVAALGAVLYGYLGATVHPAFLLGAAFSVPTVLFHATVDPRDLRSVTRNELRIIQLGILAGLSTAIALEPALWPVLPLAAIGYVAHLAISAAPPELVRAWRRAPCENVDPRGTSK